MSIDYFNSKYLPEEKTEYVCIIDILGTKEKMKASIHHAANYIFKLHATILGCWRELKYRDISVYPIMDGAYITASDKNHMLSLVSDIFKHLVSYLFKHDFKYWYLVRCSIAYGQTIHGRDIPYMASNEFEARVGYKEQLLIGSAMIAAYYGEGKAAPMGVYIDDSAHDIPNDWKWYSGFQDKVKDWSVRQFKVKIQNYYDWLGNHNNDKKYPAEKLAKHIELIKTYFEV